MKKKRIDLILVEQNFFDSREKAKRALMAGIIFVDGQRVDKAGAEIASDAIIEVKGTAAPFVSRGGEKLQAAVKEFKIDLKEAVTVDMGASTGGFTDCMLQNGAKKVYSVDVGYGQLDWKLRNDKRVVNIERTNIRYMDTGLIDEKPGFISIDVSFISLNLILPVAAKLIGKDGLILALIKPQFEAGREQVGKGGIVKDPKIHREVIEKVVKYAKEVGLYPKGLMASPIKGAKGNREFLILLAPGEPSNEFLISLPFVEE